jgi:hypothetical protein
VGVDLDNEAVGAAWGDYDNDGFPDLSVMSYAGPPGQQVPRNSLFHNEGGKGFRNVLIQGGPLDVGDHGVAWADFDRDGDVDLSVTKGYTAVGGHYLFRNLLPAGQARQSLQVSVLDAKGRSMAPVESCWVRDRSRPAAATARRARRRSISACPAPGRSPSR